jgi:paraquat-inducible protein B
VGAFVLGAVALILAAIVVFSAGDWFARRDRFTVFFPGSVKGLNKGAPVTFRGIKVGEVADVRAVLTGRPDPPIQIEVVIEIIGDVVETPPGVPRPFGRATTEEFAKGLIERGVRARMLSASLLTGQRYIDLDFLPEEPARFAGLHPRYPELPTTPTSMEKIGDKAEQFFSKVAELPLDDMLEDVRKALAAVRSVLESPGFKEFFASANRSAKKLESVLEEAGTTLKTAQETIATYKDEASQTGGQARQALQKLRTTLERAESTLRSLEQTIRGTDDTRQTATNSLEELSRTMKALRNLIDYIQTHPEAVVLGKERAKEQK